MVKKNKMLKTLKIAIKLDW